MWRLKILERRKSGQIQEQPGESLVGVSLEPMNSDGK